MDYYSDIGQTIKELRLKENISRKELCSGICSVSFLSRIESGQRVPNVIILKQFSRKLGVTPELLFRMIEPKCSRMIYEFASLVQIDLELHRYAKIYEETSNIMELEFTSISDKQMVMAIHYISEYCIEMDTDKALKQLSDVLEMTYGNDSQLSFTEMALLTEIALVHLRCQNYKAAKDIKDQLDEQIIQKDHMGFIISKIKYDIVVVIIHYLDKEFQLAHQKTEELIAYVKSKANHGYLIELFYLQSIILKEMGDVVAGQQYSDKMTVLKEIISVDVEGEYVFITDIALNNV